MSATNILGDLGTYLLTDATISGLVGARVFSHEIPKAQSGLDPSGTVLLRMAPVLNASDHVNLRAQGVDIIAYAETWTLAENLANAIWPVMQALRNQNVGSTGFKAAVSPMSLSQFLDEDLEWPAFLQFWEVTAGRDAA